MVPTDYTVKKGHRLQLLVLGSDVEITHRQDIITNYKVKQNSIKLNLPIITKE